jgi:phosphomannomutase
VLASAEGREILDVWHQGEYVKAPYNKLGAVRKLDDVVDRYLDYLEHVIDVDLINRARIRAVVDACNGAGAMVLPELCRRLGVELIPISCEPSGSFPHPPDPSARNMAQVSAIVRPVDAHVGFGLSSDCERISMVTDRGEALGTEATLPLMAQQILAEDGDPPIIVASAAVDSRVEQVAQKHEARVHRCGVGVQAVMQGMALEGAAVGGEWSGGVAVSKIHLAFDGLAVLARLLQAVASQGSGHALADALPQVYTRTATVPCPVSRAYSVVSRIRSETLDRNMKDLDGVRVELDGGWFYVRVSHTEPVIRIFCEAGSNDQADELMDKLHQQIQSAIQGV